MVTRVPEHCTTLQTYEELQRYAAAFADGHFNFLIVLGPPGVGKTRVFRDRLGDSACWLHGNASAFGLYCEAYRHRDRPIVLDDVDGLSRDRACVRLLKTLCQTEPAKQLSWATQAPALARDSVPRSFVTRSRVAVLGNDWQGLNADVRALEDRGQVVVFAPSADEIHRAAAWFEDAEIHAFIGRHLQLLTQHSFRAYIRAAERKNAGLDWRTAILAGIPEKARTVLMLKADPSYGSEAERVSAFVAGGFGSRSTYFAHARRITAARRR